MRELEAELAAAFRERTTDEWIERLVEEAGVPAGPVFEVDDALDNEQIDARGTVTTIEDPERGEIPVIEHPLNYGRATSGFESPPPRLGEHSREVFRELGYDEDALDELAARGAFGGD